MSSFFLIILLQTAKSKIVPVESAKSVSGVIGTVGTGLGNDGAEFVNVG